jgi:hypothetical protein
VGAEIGHHAAAPYFLAGSAVLSALITPVVVTIAKGDPRQGSAGLASPLERQPLACHDVHDFGAMSRQTRTS